MLCQSPRNRPLAPAGISRGGSPLRGQTPQATFPTPFPRHTLHPWARLPTPINSLGISLWPEIEFVGIFWGVLKRAGAVHAVAPKYGNPSRSSSGRLRRVVAINHLGLRGPTPMSLAPVPADRQTEERRALDR